MKCIFPGIEKLEKTRKVIVYILLALILFQIGFIFSNSLKNADVSTDQSGFYVKFFIEKILRLDYSLQSQEFISSITVFVRKAAHFSEYALLGSMIFMMLFCGMARNRTCFAISTVACFITGATDEFLQHFSAGRSPRIIDVLIDTAGGFTACIVLILIVRFTVLSRYSYSGYHENHGKEW